MQDSFRARVLFPIFNESGEPVAFGGRILPGSTTRRSTRTPPETPIYSKSKTLYGLNWAKADIVAADQVVVCEGYTDVIGFHRAGRAPRGRDVWHGLDRGARRLLKRFASRSCWRSTPTPPARARPSGSTSGSRSTRSRFASPRCRRGRTRASWPGPIRRRSARVGGVGVPFLGFRLQRALHARAADTPEQRARLARRRWRSSTSIRTRTCASCTPGGRGPGRAAGRRPRPARRARVKHPRARC